MSLYRVAVLAGPEVQDDDGKSQPAQPEQNVHQSRHGAQCLGKSALLLRSGCFRVCSTMRSLSIFKPLWGVVTQAGGRFNFPDALRYIAAHGFAVNTVHALSLIHI